jgi:hypothetical protein
MTLARYMSLLARDGKGGSLNTDFARVVLLNLLGTLRDSQEKSIKFSMNPHQVIVVDDTEGSLRLQPQILFETEGEVLDENSILSMRWNIVLDELDFPGFDEIKLSQVQNTLGLALLAHWLESDGYLPTILMESF